MQLCPREVNKLSFVTLGLLAQRRLARGILLNLPEASALISLVLVELARDGHHSVSALMSLGKDILGIHQVMSGIPALIDQIQVEIGFQDGTKLVTVHQPICKLEGDFNLALFGSFLPIPKREEKVVEEEEEGEEEKKADNNALRVDNPSGLDHPIKAASGSILLNQGRSEINLTVVSHCDRPIQIGSHYHFVESNPLLQFDRIRSLGRRLNIPSGTAVRFEPGEAKEVTLVEIGGRKIIRGGNGLVDGPVGEVNEEDLRRRCKEGGFLDAIQEPSTCAAPSPASVSISRSDYAAMFGPSVGDLVSLADTGLVVCVEKDLCAGSDLCGYGDECKFGGGKVIRDGMGQACGINGVDSLDVVVTNALILDYTGVFKADIGIKGGKIVGLGKAGNPDTMDGVTPGMVVGVNTDVIAAEGLIVTAGAIDSHVHFVCPQLITECLSSGVTTMIGGGVGPSTGTKATTCTPSASHYRMMLKATDSYAVNIGLTGKGNSSRPEGLIEQVEAGAVGLKLHEDWGTTPATIDCCLNVADDMDVQVTIHTDTLNEAGCVERSISAFKNRTIHTYHTEGAGGGHAPDIIAVCGESNVLPSSTNPTRPFTVNTIDEHLDMLMVCHHLDPNLPEDISFAESRIRGESIAAEGVLHDMGAISIMSSDSQAMGRIGEVIARTWQTAASMKVQRGPLQEDIKAGNNADNFRVRRYIAKVTINPAVAHGISHLVGSIEVGKIADLVLWKPQLFGAKPELVLKCGMIAYAVMGDPNASIPTPQPTLALPMFAAQPLVAGSCSFAFVSQASIDKGIVQEYGLTKQIEAVKGCRTVSKKDMKLNDVTPHMEVDPENYQVKADGEILKSRPAVSVPLAKRFFWC